MFSDSAVPHKILHRHSHCGQANAGLSQREALDDPWGLVAAERQTLLWQGVQRLSNCRSTWGQHFFVARFEVDFPKVTTPYPMVCNIFTLTEHEVRRTLRAADLRTTRWHSQSCTERLCRSAGWSLYKDFPPVPGPVHCPTLPEVVHHSTPVWASHLNDCWPVTLTPVVIKCFENLVRDHITSLLPKKSLDPHQFAYRANALSLVEQQGNYVQMLFVDYSSAFNTIAPHKMC